ncbi:CpsD/CapB family tyrosine-protein kinase [Phycisphaeraceae bacterium D3-23]
MGYIFDAINKQNAGNTTSTPTSTLNDAAPGDGTLSDEPLLFPGGLDTSDEQGDAEPPPVLSFANDTLDTEPAPATAGIIVPMKGHPWWQFWRRDKAGKVDDRLVTKTSPASSMAEEYRSIRTSILARHQQERHIVHTITSATPQEGKTITCVNLGLAFAELRNRTTVILECDLRLPTFEKLLRLDHPAGLIPYLRGDCTLDEAICKVDQGGLHVITAGDRVSDEAVQLLSSPRMGRLIQALRAKFDHVIIDTPPVLELADAGILGARRATRCCWSRGCAARRAR